MTYRPRKLSTLADYQFDATIVSKLNGVADRLRDLKTKPFGARPYQVSLIWTQWSGGYRGAGTEQVFRRIDILPTPQIENLNALLSTLQSVGVDEVGTVSVTEISPQRYTEDVLVGLLAGDGSPIPEDLNFYWEIHFPRPGTPGVRRRFVPRSAPSLDATRFQWTIQLLRASQDRTRSGTPEG